MTLFKKVFNSQGKTVRPEEPEATSTQPETPSPCPQARPDLELDTPRIMAAVKAAEPPSGFQRQSEASNIAVEKTTAVERTDRDVQLDRDAITRAVQAAVAPESPKSLRSSESADSDRRSELAKYAREQIQAARPQVADRAAARPLPKPVPPKAAQEQDPPAKPKTPHAAPVLDLSAQGLADMPAPAAGRAGRRAGRVKTRLLGFNTAQATEDPFGNQDESSAARPNMFPAGWLVVTSGPGTGNSFALYAGAAMLGRGEDQAIRLDFGDNSISRHNHAAIAYDDEQNKFYIGHGGKSNIIRLNDKPVLSTEELSHADLIRIGETTLRFVALGGPDFKWGATDEEASGA